MTASQPIPWKFIASTLIKFAPFWCGATLFCGGLGFGYSIFRSDVWEASQPLLIREEANGSEVRLGRFSSQSELLAAQETIIEMARNREVVEAALIKLGPASGRASKSWPTSRVIDSVASDWIKVEAPKTSEFGKTEVVYLTTLAETPERAEAFCNILFGALSEHLRTVRSVKADSIIQELQHALTLAKSNLDSATSRLAALESSVGTDLGELRGLSESLSGEGGASRLRSELDKELRTAEAELKKIEALQVLLKESQEDTTHLLVSDGDLLQSQPTLQRLKSGLIDAQLDASKLAGRVTVTHPRMVSALRSQETIRDELRAEIASVLQSMGSTITLAQRKVQTLQKKQSELDSKLSSLATIRADYSRLVSEVKNRTTLLNETQAALAEAESLRMAAESTNLLSPLGPPKAGDRPVGLGTKMLTVAAAAAGLMFGLGGVFLVAPSPNGQRFGRRLSDSMGGRRAVDRSAGHGARAIEGTVFSQRASTTDRRSINRLTGEINHKPEPVEASVLVESVRSVAASEPIVAETRPKQRPASAYEGAVKYQQPPAPPESIDTNKD